MPFLGFHSHVTVSELPWPLHPHPTSSLPTHNPGLIRKTETCSRKGLVAENTAGWTSGPLAMKTSIVPLPGPAGPHLGPPAPALKRTAAGGGGGRTELWNGPHRVLAAPGPLRAIEIGGPTVPHGRHKHLS